MKVLKYIGIVVGVLLVIFLLLGLFAPKNYHVERQISIDASKAVIFPQIVDLKKHPAWEPWQELDPDMEQTYEGPDGQVGQSVTWKGNKEVGEGRQIITAVKDQERVDVDIYFLPYEHPNPTYFALNEQDGKTKVSWGMDAHFPFPMNIFLVFSSFEKSVGGDFDKGLQKLKALCEAAPKTKIPTMNIQTIDYPATTFIANRQVVDMETLANYYAENLPAIFGFAAQKGYESIGMPRGMYYEWAPEEDRIDVAAAIAVKNENPETGDFSQIKIPAQKALRLDFYGDYEQLGDAHDALEAYMEKNNMTWAAPAIEEYVTDPTTEPDPNKWLTKLTYFFDQ